MNWPQGPRCWGAVSLGYLLDQILGEPPDEHHPLRSFATVMSATERLVYGDSRRRGILYALTGLALGGASGAVIGSTAAATYLSCGGRALVDASREVEVALLTGDLDQARRAAGRIVGRETSNLDQTQLARAAIESVAENTVDAVVAPLFFASIAGAPGALGYRALNTLDALVGHRNARYREFGWASARLDDVANYIPARFAALVVAIVRPHRIREIARALRRDAPLHPSPNGGVIEAAFAAALGVRLGGENTYHGLREVRAELGDGRPPAPADIARANRLSRDVTATFAAGLALMALMGTLRRRSARPWQNRQ